MKKSFTNLILLACLVAVPSLFNSCGNSRFESAGNSLLSSSGGSGGNAANAVAKCEASLQTAFKNTYWGVLKTNCASCHAAGGSGAGYFASTSLGGSYGVFMEKTEPKIYEYLTSTTLAHKVTGGQPGVIASTNGVRPTWLNAANAYDNCILAAGGTADDASIAVPSKFTIAKSYTIPTLTTTTVMTWNTQTEMENGANSYAGGTVSLTVTAADIGGGKVQYAFSNPRFVNANPTTPAHVKGLAVKVDGVLVAGGTTFYTLDRLVPNITNNNSRALTLNAGGSVLYLGVLNTAMSVQVGFTTLEGSTITFNPPTFTTLIANGGTFQAKCVACHGASGGLSLQTYLFVGSAANSGFATVSKWNIDDSELYRQIATDVMPKGGTPLTQDEKDRIRDWILDGAPNAPADIRR